MQHIPGRTGLGAFTPPFNLAHDAVCGGMEPFADSASIQLTYDGIVFLGQDRASLVLKGQDVEIAMNFARAPGHIELESKAAEPGLSKL